MPGITELEQLSKSYSLAIAVLIVGCMALTTALAVLYRANREVSSKLQLVLEERVKALESYVSELCRDSHHV